MEKGIEHRCACGNVLGRTKETRPAVGKPFSECSACGGLVARPPFREWALLTPPERIGILARALVPAALLGALPALLVAVIAGALGREPSATALAALALAGPLLTLGGAALRLSSAVRRSRRRMADPMYQARLVEFAMPGRKAAGPAGPRSAMDGPPADPGAPSTRRV